MIPIRWTVWNTILIRMDCVGVERRRMKDQWILKRIELTATTSTRTIMTVSLIP